MEIPYEDIAKIVAALVAGGLLGFEREYKDKPAGMRTIILITVGSALFSLLNLHIKTESPDRIASTVVTGIGFVGAGVIYKEGINVRGLTTAATIWVSAAIGMALGFGNYWMASTTVLLTLITLVSLRGLEKKMEAVKNLRDFRFTFLEQDYSMETLEQKFNELGIRHQILRLSKDNDEICVEYKLKIRETGYRQFLEFLMGNKCLKGFEEKG